MLVADTNPHCGGNTHVRVNPTLSHHEHHAGDGKRHENVEREQNRRQHEAEPSTQQKRGVPPIRARAK